MLILVPCGGYAYHHYMEFCDPCEGQDFRTYITGVRVQDEGERLPITAQLIEADGTFERTANPC